MSCEICILSSIQNVKQIRTLLFPNCKGKEEKNTDWQQVDWSWKNESVTEAIESDSWLQQCLCSISPIGDVFAIANEDTAVFLTLKWEDSFEHGSNERFIVSGTETLPASEEFDGITSIFCLPLASSRRSSYGRPDWTAVVIGTRLGHVKIFTEKGHLLVSQKFHEEPVTGFKCRTFDPHISAALAEQQEEVIVLYKTAVVTIDGFSLYQTLRACRSQVAKATARGSESIQPPPIAYKKWVFQDQDLIRDCESLGVAYVNIFDNLMNISIQKGHCVHASMLTSAASVFLTTGQSPYASFCYAVEGSSPVLMKDVATAVASKLKSVITNFFGGNSKTPADKVIAKIEPATPLPNRFELRDSIRMGERIFTSPNRCLSAITDDFGRVILIDNVEGIAVRIWKGYRDAQCAWIEVNEDESETVEGRDKNVPLRIANFLIIYAPRRGILEVWTIQQGPRIAAFNIGKHARLIYCNHGILGLTNVKSAQDGKLQSKSVYFLDAEGVIKTVTIPFHYALSAKFSKRVRDLHLFNKLKAYLKNIKDDLDQVFEDISEFIIDIKTNTILLQALDLIMTDKYCSVDLLKFVFTKLKDHLLTTDSKLMDLESKLLYFDCLRKLQLLDFFENIEKMENKAINTNDEDKPLRVLSEIFNVTEAEVDLILGRIGKYYKNCNAKKCVKFERNERLQVGNFLLCFQTYCTTLPNIDVDASIADVTDTFTISLNSTITEPELTKLAYSIFDGFLHGNIEIEEIKRLLFTSGIEMEMFMNLLIKCWLQFDVNLDNHICLKNLFLLLNFLSCSTGTLNNIPESKNGLSLWKTFGNIFIKSNNIPAAYTVALTCRGLVIEAYASSKNVKENLGEIDSEKHSIANNSSDKDSNLHLLDWETIHLESEHWNLLVKQLEDAISIITIIFFKLPASFVSASYYNFIEVHQTVSISTILEGGKGAISELFAKWMSCLQYDSLVELGLLTPGDNSDNYYYFHQAKSLDSANSDHQSFIMELKTCFDEALTRFPLSLNSDVLITTCCWEFAALWNKDKDNIQNLINSMKCFGFVLSFEYGKGLGVLLWHTFFKTSFCSVAVLLEKVGKTPKERLCRKEVGMSDVSLQYFTGCSLYLLTSLWRNYSSRSNRSTSPFVCEDVWQIDNSKPSLIDIIVFQKDPNYDLVFNHFKLAMIMHLTLTLGVKSVKPLSLNGSENGLLILKDLSTSIISYEILPSLKEKQVLVLCKGVTLAVTALSLPNYSSESEPDLHLQYSTAEHVRSRQWISKILELANVMELECDVLQRHYVLELYSSGFDMLAEESIRSVDDREQLGSQLLLLAGQRVYYIIQNSGNQYVKLLSLFPPLVTTWFETLNQNSLRCMYVPLSLTATIIGYVINVIPENRTEHKIAVSLLDPLQIMRNDIEKKF